MKLARLLPFAALLVPLGNARAQDFVEVHRMVPAQPGYTLAAAAGDLDGDGDADVLIGSVIQNHVYANDGTGVLTDLAGACPVKPGGAFSGSPESEDVALADVDADGDLDALIGNSSGRNWLYLNSGTAAFAYANDNLPFDPSVALTTGAVAIADLDGDGDPDAAIGSYGPKDWAIRNDGTGKFSIVSGALPVFLDETRAIAAGDVDGDGDLDLLYGNGSYPTRLYANGGSGTFAEAAAPLPSVPAPVSDVALADVDGDGDLDAYLGCGTDLTGAQDHLFRNQGSGTFADVTAAQLPILGDATTSVALEDIDGDGDADALIGNGGPDAVLANDGTGHYSVAALGPVDPFGGATLDVLLVDLDQDFDADAFFGKYYQDRLALGDGNGGWTEVTVAAPEAFDFYTRALALGDVDADGDPDVVAGNDGHANVLYRNDGTGELETVPGALPAQAYETYAVALEDVDGDGDRDAVVGNVGAPERMYLNDGTGLFAPAPAQFPSFPDKTRGIALGDVDGDGDRDAVLANLNLSRLFRNDGAGTFAEQLAPFQGFVAWDVALGDVEGDGDLDLYFGTYGRERLFLNDGAGGYAELVDSTPPMLDATRAVALADIDADGDPDALTGQWLEPARLHRNQLGTLGAFVDDVLPGCTCLQHSDVALLADGDGDGDADAFLSHLYYRNDGTGLFSDATGSMPAAFDNVYALALGDLDGDGDADLVQSAMGPESVYRGTARQLAWHGLPRVGKPLSLDLYGAPSAPWFLAFALGTASLPLAPFGELLLDPATLHVAGGGALDGGGRASVTFAVPADGSLVGAALHWQALSGLPLRLGNRERTTLTAF